MEGLLGCTHLALEQILDLACRHQLDVVELRGIDGNLDVPDRLEELFPSPTVFAARFANDPIRIGALDTSLRLSGNTKEDRAAFLRFVLWAEALSVPRVRAFDGTGLADNAALARALDTLTWWRALRAEHGWRVDLMVETHSSLVTTASIGAFGGNLPCAKRQKTPYTEKGTGMRTACGAIGKQAAGSSFGV